MKKLLFVFSFLISFLFANAQSWLWGRQAIPKLGAQGDLNSDHPVAVDASGNAYMTGVFFDTLNFGTFALTSSFESMFLAKYDEYGNVLWAKQAKNLNSLSFGMGNSVAIDRSGNVYVTGIFYDTISFGSIKISVQSSFSNVFLAKYDPLGNVIWAKQTIPSSNKSYGYGYSVAIDNSGNPYITGAFHDTISFGAFTLISSASQGDVFLTKYDANGNVLWAKQANNISSSSFGNGASVATDASGNVYITGTFNDTLSFGAYTLISSPFQSAFKGDVFLTKYDASGNVLWAKQANMTTNTGSSSEATSIAIDGLGNVYITGAFNGSYTFGSFSLGPSSGAFLVKYNAAGDVLWAKQTEIDGLSQWGGYSVASDTLNRGGGYIVMESSNGSPFNLKFGIDTFNLNNNNQTATVIIQFDSSGSILRGSIFSEGSEDDGDGIGVDRTGQHVYVAGDLENITIFTSDTLIPIGEIPFIALWQTSIWDSLTNAAYKDRCVFVPNAFSPNGDEQNDILYVKGLCIKTMDFVIFDRWGNKVFESENINTGWDGTYKGKPMNSGNFVYYITGTLYDGTTFKKQGSIALIR